MNEHSEAILYRSVDALATLVEDIKVQLPEVATVLCDCLLSDGKIIICGNGFASPIASLFASTLIGQHEFDRPSLPAINISSNSANLSILARDGNLHDVFSKQINAIGNSGDTLFALSIDGNCGNIIQAVQAAHAKDIQVVVLVGKSGGNISALIQPDDQEICLQAEHIGQALEAQLVCCNTLCNLMEFQLFGGYSGLH